MPETLFVVMSGLLLPERSEYTALTMQINKELQALCDEYDYMFFVDASDMTFDGQSYNTKLFLKDGIHLNREGQLRLCNNYIQPFIEYLESEFKIDIRK